VEAAARVGVEPRRVRLHERPQRLLRRGERGLPPVPGEAALAAAVEEPRLGEHLQVVGDRRLPEVEDLLDFADVERPLDEEARDLEAGRVGEGPESRDGVRSDHGGTIHRRIKICRWVVAGRRVRACLP
jgi:hypothetical protein